MPDSFKVIFLVLFVYVTRFGLGVMGAVAYIKYGNWLILIFSTMLVFAGTVLPGLATIIEGNTRVMFLGGKRAKAFPQ